MIYVFLCGSLARVRGLPYPEPVTYVCKVIKVLVCEEIHHVIRIRFRSRRGRHVVGIGLQTF